MIIMHSIERTCFLLLSVLVTSTAAAAAAAFVPAPAPACQSPPPLAATVRTTSQSFFMAAVPGQEGEESVSSPSTTTTSRRDVLKHSLAAALTAAVMSKNSATASAAGEIDFAKVQDLLGDTAMTSPEAYSSTRRPMYLTEPTDEFKANEAKTSEFKRAQLARKRQFQTILDKLQSDPNDAAMLEQDLDDMRKLVTAGLGLPLGITKQDVISQVRRRKATKFWPTRVEIAYQDLVSEINYQQSPNTEKNADNPL
jgi:hypothetical protein